MTDKRSAWRTLLLEIGLPLLLVAALDAGFGVYLSRQGGVPLPQLFGADPLTTGKFFALRDRALQPPVLDVLLLGMSQMMRVNGQQLENELSERAQRPVRTFNFSGPFHSFAFDQLLIRDIVSPIGQPAVVVYGVTPLTLLNEVLGTAPTEARAEALPVFGLYVDAPLRRVRGLVTMHVNLLRYREVIREALEWPPGWKVPPFDPQAHATTPTGDVPLVAGHFEVRGLSAWERSRRLRFEDFDGVLGKTLLFDHLTDFARYCHQHGIELVLLNNPVHPFFLQVLPHERQDYDRYLARLRQAAAQAHALLFEPAPDGIGAPDLYGDTVHHDDAGGAWLTTQLADYLIDNHLIAR